MITLMDIHIEHWDQYFIDNLSEKLDVDYMEAGIEEIYNIDTECFANWVIYVIYEIYLDRIGLDCLSIEGIMKKISKWINCLATSIPFNMDEYIKENNLEKYREELLLLDN